MARFSTATLSSRIKQILASGKAFLKEHRRLIQYAFSIAILIFLGLYIYQNARELARYELSLNLPSLALASVLVLMVNFLTPLTWGLVLWLCLEERLPWRQSLHVWFVSQVSKYLPGSIWNYVSRVYLCGERGIPSSKSILSMLLEIMLILLAQALVVLLSLPFWVKGTQNVLWVLLILPLGLVVLHPKIFNGLLTVAARRSGLEKPPPVNLSPANGGSLLGIYTAGAIVVGVAFFFFANSLYPLSLNLLPVLTGIVSMSLIVGFLAPIAPYGLGVREGLLTVLLSQYMPAPVAAVIALASRLWFTCGELAGLLISLVLQPKAPNNPNGLSRSE